MILKQDVQSYLTRWDHSVDSKYSSKRLELESRRHFLKLALSGIALLSASPMLCAKAETQSDLQWRTMQSVLLHLFPPAPGTPDADSINAIGYFKAIMKWSGVDKSDKKFLLDGIGWLNGLAEKQFKKTFYQLDTNTKEIVLRTVEKSQAGENWLSLIMLYLIEALLTDPVYGGNVNGKGWQWLEHQPGFPSPSADKRYFNL